MNALFIASLLTYCAGLFVYGDEIAVVGQIGMAVFLGLALLNSMRRQM